jgi:aminoglycoside phosphotransferase (APT) family kinase protein
MIDGVTSDPDAEPEAAHDPPVKMHADELEIDAGLVRRLLASQFPRWADLPLERVRSSGTDNAIYRLGNDLSVRLPRIHWAADQPQMEQRWLPQLAPQLPVSIPVPVATGKPADGYPWAWTVCPWFEGQNPGLGLRESDALVAEVAAFVAAMRRVRLPAPPESSFGRPLATRDGPVRESIEALTGMVDTDVATAIWEAALAAPTWAGPPTWVHGDLMPGNLIVDGGKLRAVIDFSLTGVGDPACDLIPAWNLFTADGRAAFRDALQVEDDMWSRARGLAFSKGIIALPYYKDTNPGMAVIARYTINEVVTEYTREN